MGRTFRISGLVLAAVAVWLFLAGAMGWIHEGTASRWGALALKYGGLCFAAGMLLALLAPIGREFRRGRCVRCGSAIERGQTYCMDHLQEAVNEYRDRTRGEMSRHVPKER